MSGEEDIAKKEIAALLGKTFLQVDEKATNIQDLSCHLSHSAIFRVAFRYMDAKQGRAVFKAVNFQEGGLIRTEDSTCFREIRFFESLLPKVLAPYVTTPKIYAIQQDGPRSWIVMEDVSEHLTVKWSFDRLLDVVRSLARFHSVYSENKAILESYDWLRRNEHGSYSGYIAEGLENIKKIPEASTTKSLFGERHVQLLKDCLNSWDVLNERMKKLPLSLCHGDFHVKNLGFDDNNKMVLIDWPHVGLAPLGCDLATLVSIFEIMGGGFSLSEKQEQQLFDTYIRDLQDLGTTFSEADVTTAYNLWHITWGLHLRLGPGLSFVYEDNDVDPAIKAASLRDIVKGCRRACKICENDRTTNTR